MKRNILFAFLGGVCVVIAVFLLIEYLDIKQRGEEIKELDQKIRNTDLFNLPQEPQGQVLTVKQQHEQCLNRQQYLKAMDAEVDEKC